jgi:hypothetical protein
LLSFFVQAVHDRRFDNLLFYVHTYAKLEETKELMRSKLGLVLEEMMIQAKGEGVQYEHDFEQ